MTRTGRLKLVSARAFTSQLCKIFPQRVNSTSALPEIDMQGQLISAPSEINMQGTFSLTNCTMHVVLQSIYVVLSQGCTVLLEAILPRMLLHCCVGSMALGPGCRPAWESMRTIQPV